MLGYLQIKDNIRISLKSREHHIRGVHSLAVVLSIKIEYTKKVKVNISSCCKRYCRGFYVHFCTSK